MVAIGDRNTKYEVIHQSRYLFQIRNVYVLMPKLKVFIYKMYNSHMDINLFQQTQ